MSRAVIQGCYSDLRFVKSRKVAQVVVEIPIEAADEFIRMFGSPNPAAEIPVALARIAAGPADQVAEPYKTEKPRRDWSDLKPSQQAGIRCNDPEFVRYLELDSTEHAADYIRAKCRVASRSDLNTDAEARRRWSVIDDGFALWKLGARR